VFLTEREEHFPDGIFAPDDHQMNRADVKKNLKKAIPELIGRAAKVKRFFNHFLKFIWFASLDKHTRYSILSTISSQDAVVKHSFPRIKILLFAGHHQRSEVKQYV
tara:strand:- start:227 stop:544 length:318 start_codon:yes stop_codon:yes gene_type:complete